MSIRILDNSNLAESYTGVTTPLTYSFVRDVYARIYVHFCRLMGVSTRTIRANEAMFPSMIARAGYRLYYDLLQWYRLISFLPGYSYNKGFFEQMIGVEESLLEDNHEVKKTSWDSFILVRQILLICVEFVIMGPLTKIFLHRFHARLHKLQTINLKETHATELWHTFQDAQQKLAGLWSIPIANDFAVMVSVGLSRKLADKWGLSGDVMMNIQAQAIQNLSSLDPGAQLQRIVVATRNDATVSNFLKAGPTTWNDLQKQFQNHEVITLIKDYIRRYGHRVPNELKLESPTFHENPDLLIHILQAETTHQDTTLRKSFFEPQQKLALPLAKRVLLKWLWNWARRSLERREETRFCRTLIFGYTRSLFLRLADIFVEKKVIDDRSDIFFLELSEIGNISQGTYAGTSPKKLVQKRRNEYTRWKSIDLPRRIQLDQPLADFEKTFLESTVTPEIKLSTLSGLSVLQSDRIVSGEALVLKEFDPTQNYTNKIVVTSHTDPGWTIIFPLLKGIIVERGGLLSHAAIVARELHLPCIIGVTGATDVIMNGQTIDLNLADGTIHI